MLSNFNYTGEVKISNSYNNNSLSKTFFNNGTKTLFKIYSLALLGQVTPSLLPSNVRIIGNTSETVMEDLSAIDSGEDLLKTSSVSIIKEYIEKSNDGQIIPTIRITTSLSREMFNSIDKFKTVYIILENTSVGTDKKLAYVKLVEEDVNTFKSIISSTGVNNQLIITWDLSISNKSN